MQRAAAATPPTPLDDAQDVKSPPLKRQKISEVPSENPVTELTRGKLSQQTTAGEGQKSVRPIGEVAKDSCETKWVLHAVDAGLGNGGRTLFVTKAGYADIEEGAWRSAISGRKSFGKFKMEVDVRLYCPFYSTIFIKYC